MTYALAMVVGFTIGNIYMMQTLLTSEIYGVVSLGGDTRLVAPQRPAR